MRLTDDAFLVHERAERVLTADLGIRSHLEDGRADHSLVADQRVLRLVFKGRNVN